MVRNLLACLTLWCCATTSVSLLAQTPELSLVARSTRDLQVVLTSLGERGESLGLDAPATFLKNYEQHIDAAQPLTAVCVFSTDVPMFAAEFMSIEPTQFWTALAEDGLVLDAKTGQLSTPNSNLQFYVEQIGKKIRVSDNAQFLKKVRLPESPSFTGALTESAVVVTADWRNLQPATRQAISLQVMGLLLPQSQTGSGEFSLANLPEVISQATAQRISSWFIRAETMDLRFQIDGQQNVRLAVDVVNRTLMNVRPTASPFVNAPLENALAQGQWNVPLDMEMRRVIQGWAGLLAGDISGMFRNEQIASDQGRDVVQEASRLLARHAGEFLSLQNIQASYLSLERDGRPVLAAGLRVANPARLDTELQKLLQALVNQGVPLKLRLNQAAAYDSNLHRIEVNLPEQLSDAREILGDVLVIHLATTTHALLVGVGNGSDELMMQMITPGADSQSELVSAVLARNTQPIGLPKSGLATSGLSSKLGLVPAAVSVTSLPQGFRILADLPTGNRQNAGRLTRTQADY